MTAPLNGVGVRGRKQCEQVGGLLEEKWQRWKHMITESNMEV